MIHDQLVAADVPPEEHMRIHVDTEKCVGADQCAMAAPEIFDQNDEDGTVILLQAEPASQHADTVSEAVMLYPAQAIQLRE
jgi:ferredoxin